MPKKNREEYNAYMREYMLARYHRRRAAAIEQLGGKCVECGGVEDLEVDHIDWRLKSKSISKILGSGSERLVQDELTKCQVLCLECHKKKSAIDIRVMRTGSRELICGTTHKYNKGGCRCGECVEAVRSYHREYRQRKKQEKIHSPVV